MKRKIRKVYNVIRITILKIITMTALTVLLIGATVDLTYVPDYYLIPYLGIMLICAIWLILIILAND